MNIRRKSLFTPGKRTQNNLIKLIDDNARNLIILVDINSTPKEVNNCLDEYMNFHPCSNDKSSQTGRAWIMVGKKKRNGELVSLNVGQSQDIISEIRKILGEALINKNTPYYELLKKYSKIAFWEIDIDSYIKKHLKMKKSDLKDLAYELSKDYLAEYLVAKNTASKHWCHGTGMDKRFYFHFDKKGL